MSASDEADRFAPAAIADRTKEAWERHVRGGGLVPELVRAHVHRAWRRCELLGASPRTRVAVALEPDALGYILERERDLLEAAEPYMHALVKAAGGEHHAAMLGSANGAVLRVLGDAEHIEAPGFPRAGSLLDERTSGANGIGSPLAEGRYVELVGPEHFIEGFHAYTCQGIPIRAPNGETVCVLSISVRRVQAAERVREILICAASGMEMELMRRRLELDTDRLLTSGNVDAVPFERLRQDVVQVHAAARLKLEIAAIAAGRSSARDALVLARAAEELIERFRQRSSLWLLLASDDASAPTRLDVRLRVLDVVELLQTEASIRGFQIVVAPGGPVFVTEDAATMSRHVFRALLRAMTDSRTGETITVRVDGGGDEAFVVISHAGEEQIALTYPHVGG